ncbi:MAG: aminopeptidase [Deltaproteobacteria bacterium]|nr:aminopeptidase [Deltaproteobacteria bacterium]
MTRALVLGALALAGCSSIMPRYLAQAAYGQAELLSKARPIEQVVADPNTPVRTAMLLSEIPAIKDYGRSYGLRIKGNYAKYTALGRPAAVWFVGAADPLAFKPLRWCFPIVGCFAGVGWFDEDDAVQHKVSLDQKGYDAIVRPASAYSTGGWFSDPVLSTMLGGGDDALPELCNVILHESVHATILVPDQPFFNESLASYVADALTDNWIITRFGRGSPEELAWTLGQAISLPRTARMLDTYTQLKTLYDGPLPPRQKLAAKATIIDELVADLQLRRRPNNASLTETRVYNGGVAPILEAHRACGDLRSLVEAGKTLTRADFTKTLQEDLVPVGKVLAERCRLARTRTVSVPTNPARR